MIQNMEWIKTQIRRLTLEGISQEEISHGLDVSEGTVSAVIQELRQSDRTLSWQHEIAVVCKKYGISVHQLGSNLVFSNALRRRAVENNKIDNVLKAIDATFSEDGSHSSQDIAELILQICNLAVKNHTDIDAIYSEIEEKINLLKQLKVETVEVQNQTQKALDNRNLTLTKLEYYEKCRKAFEDVGLDLENWRQTVNVLNNIKEVGFNHKRLLRKMRYIQSLEDKKTELESACQEKLNVLEMIQRKERAEVAYWNVFYTAKEQFTQLVQKGVPSNIMARIFDVVIKYLQYFPIDNFAEDYDTYGAVKVACYKQTRELERLKGELAILEFKHKMMTVQ